MKLTELWVFYQYKTGRSSEPDRNDPENFIRRTIFTDFNEMKEFSANESAIWRKVYPDYCSEYDKFVISE